jgi:biopolymer transport protein ExbD
MAFGGFNDNRQPGPMSEINVTPMVDVMLVLLVIFIITAPLFTHSIRLDLPAAAATASAEKPDTITLSVDAKGEIFWDNGASSLDMNELNRRLALAAQKKPQPEIQLRADKSTRFEVIAQVMAAAQAGGLSKLGFVTDPKDASTGK